MRKIPKMQKNAVQNIGLKSLDEILFDTSKCDAENVCELVLRRHQGRAD
jgi:hypothetical protein